MITRWLFGTIVVAGSLTTVLAQTPRKQEAPQPATKPPASSEIAAIVAGRPVTTKELDEKLGTRIMQLRTQEYRLRKGALEEIVTTAVIEKEAAARGISIDELTAAEIEAKAKPVTEEEARAVLESARDRMGPISDADAIQSITAGMRKQRLNQRRSEFAAELKGKFGVQLLIEPPRFKLATPDGPSIGPSDARVTVVEFSDFQCPYCARSAETVRQLVDKYQGKIRLVFEDLPLPIHRDASKAAEAGACAHDQGKFWPMHDKLFASQKNLSVPELKQYAVELGLDATAFNVCVDTGKHAEDWKRSKAAADGYGITGTPAFFVNGIPLFGAAPLHEFTSIIDDELARVGAAPAPPKAAAAAEARP